MRHCDITEDNISPIIQHLLTSFLQYLITQKRYSHHTIDSYHRDLRHYFSFLSQHLNKTLSQKDLELTHQYDIRSWFVARLHDKKSAISNRRALSAVKSFYKYCAQYHALENDQIAVIRGPNIPKSIPKALSVNDACQTIDYARQTDDEEWVALRDTAILLLLYGAGLRISEALSLNYDDWQLCDGGLRIIGKGHKERYVPILDKIISAIESYILVCPYHFEVNTPLFYGKKGKRLTRGIIAKKMVQIRHMLGLPDSTTPHALRHSFATHILAESDDLRAVQELLGHSHLSTTQRYTDVNIASLLNTYQKAHPDFQKDM